MSDWSILREDDEQLMRIVRGINAVDRAARRYRDRVPGNLDALVPESVARLLGWTICTRCGRHVSPGWAIHRGDETFHPVCMLTILREDAAAATSVERARELIAA